MNMHAMVSSILGLSLLGFGAMAESQVENSWFQQGQAVLKQRQAEQNKGMRAKNVILFVGDGMSVATVSAARILEGQLRGESGEENLLSFERFPYTAMSKTYNVNAQTPDSAGTATAMMSGVKTNIGVIGVNEHVIYGDCASQQGNDLKSLLEMAETKGLATGVVTTTRLTHATPASTYAHVVNRNWENDGDIPSKQRKLGCKDIALQLIESPYGNGLEIAMGGGRRNFLPRTKADPEKGKGQRADGRDLSQEWLSGRPDSAYVWRKSQLAQLDLKKTQRILGLFEKSHMGYERERDQSNDEDPTLTEMTATAISFLSQSESGYFLMVEGGRIDHAHHESSAGKALYEAIEFSNAIQKAIEMTSDADTLIIVTADHAHTMTFAGYPSRGNPILGLVDSVYGDKPLRAIDGKAFTTLGYANGPAAVTGLGGRTDPATQDTYAVSYHQVSLIPLKSETHGGDDVVIYASGPNAHLFRGVVEQNFIYHVMRDAFGW